MCTKGQLIGLARWVGYLGKEIENGSRNMFNHSSGNSMLLKFICSGPVGPVL